ncbi:hypothetical protein M0D21_13830 [Aquimarina sp. D1M17]|uniref:hypothetical protein n=1 Tax=Aquimarina acroporae TaxID=2937283 RepID=UPI0020BF1BEE|nr:hypothetical protein [Aquimarina acroporae]MCK8522659.1 hypothetical protein [Aquimarina acroporae]
MKHLILTIALLVYSYASYAYQKHTDYNTKDFKISKATVIHDTSIASTIWKITVEGNAGLTTPTPAGQLHGAPVLGYVFPTTLQPEDVGFNPTSGIVALALTSHPDFDDTPLWDENSDKKFDNDGVIWHPHWVILHEDKRVDGGLSVKQFKKDDKTVVLPPTNPGMPMYMDSPGYQVTTQRNEILVVIPDYRIHHKVDFKFDAVSAYMEVNTNDKDRPMLGVYKVYSILSKELSLPFIVQSK